MICLFEQYKSWGKVDCNGRTAARLYAARFRNGHTPSFFVRGHREITKKRKIVSRMYFFAWDVSINVQNTEVVVLAAGAEGAGAEAGAERGGGAAAGAAAEGIAAEEAEAAAEGAGAGTKTEGEGGPGAGVAATEGAAAEKEEVAAEGAGAGAKVEGGAAAAAETRVEQ